MVLQCFSTQLGVLCSLSLVFAASAQKFNSETTVCQIVVLSCIVFAGHIGTHMYGLISGTAATCLREGQDIITLEALA